MINIEKQKNEISINYYSSRDNAIAAYGKIMKC